MDFNTKYGPWAVVTGASSGIGRAIAQELVAKGLHLVLVARRQETLQALVSDLEAQHAIECRPVAADLGAEAGRRAVEDATRDLDVGLLVAAAGFGTTGQFLDADLDAEYDMLTVNAWAILEQAHHFGRRFADRGRGGLILFGSIVGFQGTPYAAHYAATKAYVQTLAEALHLELGPHGVDVVSSAPGPVHSGFAERADQKMGAAIQPEDVAKPTLAALGRRMTTYPGLLTKVLSGSLALLPRWARARIMKQVMGGMTAHQREHA